MTPEALAPIFAAELERRSPLLDLEVRWPGAVLRRRTFIGEIDCPAPLVRSARAVVFKGGKVVVVSTVDGPDHVEPGGGVEPGETIEAAARREIREETGWTVAELTPLGFHHYQHLSAPPPGALNWRDFVNIVFVAEAVSYDRRARDMTQIETGSRLIPIRRALAALVPEQATLLRAAITRRGEAG